MKKINPRRRPATQADVNRATIAATNKAIQFVATIILYILKDKFAWKEDQLLKLHGHFQKTIDMITEGRLSFKDIQTVLGEEYDIEITEKVT